MVLSLMIQLIKYRKLVSMVGPNSIWTFSTTRTLAIATQVRLIQRLAAPHYHRHHSHWPMSSLPLPPPHPPHHQHHTHHLHRPLISHAALVCFSLFLFVIVRNNAIILMDTFSIFTSKLSLAQRFISFARRNQDYSRLYHIIYVKRSIFVLLLKISKIRLKNLEFEKNRNFFFI